MKEEREIDRREWKLVLSAVLIHHQHTMERRRGREGMTKRERERENRSPWSDSIQLSHWLLRGGGGRGEDTVQKEGKRKLPHFFHLFFRSPPPSSSSSSSLPKKKFFLCRCGRGKVGGGGIC